MSASKSYVNVNNKTILTTSKELVSFYNQYININLHTHSYIYIHKNLTSYVNTFKIKQLATYCLFIKEKINICQDEIKTKYPSMIDMFNDYIKTNNKVILNNYLNSLNRFNQLMLNSYKLLNELVFVNEYDLFTKIDTFINEIIIGYLNTPLDLRKEGNDAETINDLTQKCRGKLDIYLQDIYTIINEYFETDLIVNNFKEMAKIKDIDNFNETEDCSLAQLCNDENEIMNNDCKSNLPVCPFNKKLVDVIHPLLKNYIHITYRDFNSWHDDKDKNKKFYVNHKMINDVLNSFNYNQCILISDLKLSMNFCSKNSLNKQNKKAIIKTFNEYSKCKMCMIKHFMFHHFVENSVVMTTYYKIIQYREFLMAIYNNLEKLYSIEFDTVFYGFRLQYLYFIDLFQESYNGEKVIEGNRMNLSFTQIEEFNSRSVVNYDELETGYIVAIICIKENNPELYILMKTILKKFVGIFNQCHINCNEIFQPENNMNENKLKNILTEFMSFNTDEEINNGISSNNITGNNSKKYDANDNENELTNDEKQKMIIDFILENIKMNKVYSHNDDENTYDIPDCKKINCDRGSCKKLIHYEHQAEYIKKISSSKRKLKNSGKMVAR